MDDQVNLPHDVYTRLIDAAQHEGTTPAGWIEQHLPPPQKPAAPKEKEPAKPQTMLEALGDLVGSVHSGGKDQLSIRHSELFAEYLEQKRREGRL